MIEYQPSPFCLFVLTAAAVPIGHMTKVQYSPHVGKLSPLDTEKHTNIVCRYLGISDSYSAFSPCM